MSGTDVVKALMPYVTTFGKGTININTVTQETMEWLGLNPFEIEAVLKQRNAEVGGFRFIPQQFAAYGLNATSSDTFRIDVEATVKGSTRSARITAVVNRERDPGGYKMQTIYWRESAENIRG
jgi:hypothetical protein